MMSPEAIAGILGPVVILIMQQVNGFMSGRRDAATQRRIEAARVEADYKLNGIHGLVNGKLAEEKGRVALLTAQVEEMRKIIELLTVSPDYEISLSRQLEELKAKIERITPAT